MITEVADPSQVAAARRVAVELAKSQGADEMTAGRIAIVTTEMASNILKHASSGHIAADLFHDAAGLGIEVLAFDKGQGIDDIGGAMADGYSTAGTSGGGLGAIQRQADHFAIYSKPDRGTAIAARFILSDVPRGATTIGHVQAPYPGEVVSGDGWAFAESDHGPTLMMVDGSGHGRAAEIAAKTAERVFHENLNESCTLIMERIHQALASTRGGAVAIARLDTRASLVRYVGVGNIFGLVTSNTGTRRMVSHNGTAGFTAPRIREFLYDYSGSSTVVLHSDGLSAKWDLAAYPGLAASAPSLIAGVLFRDCWRGRDDGLVVALRLDARRNG